ncbi:IS66 family transposase [Klebsiella variicola]|uniref:IS66 family transposase n=1 Tax=Klebsiella variicola TaxID=244366 RepID=UPI000D7490DF|nr:hypothetical protein DMS07_28515 [Klebsiella variicola]
MTYYADDGWAEADNNLAENALRMVSLGRKNGSVALRLRQVKCCFFLMLPTVTVNVPDPKYLQTSALSRRRYCSVCPLVSGLLTESA